MSLPFRPALSVVMPGHKREARLRQIDPGIHVFGATRTEVVDGRDKPGHDELRELASSRFSSQALPTHLSFTIARYGESWPKVRTCLGLLCCVEWSKRCVQS